MENKLNTETKIEIDKEYEIEHKLYSKVKFTKDYTYATKYADEYSTVYCYETYNTINNEWVSHFKNDYRIYHKTLNGSRRHLFKRINAEYWSLV